jgi:multiple sugar transport system substrate-binding protein
MSEGRTEVTRRRFLGGALGAAAALPVVTRRAGAQARPTISYWNGLTGADGKVMDELIDQFTRDTGIRVEQQRIQWADLYAKLQVSVPAGEGPDLALIHTVEVPHFASDEVLEPIDDGALAGKGFRGEDYLPSTWQGGLFQGKRYAIPLDVPQHLFYMNVGVMRQAGLVGPDGKPKVPGSGSELVAMAKQVAKGDTFGFAIGTVNPGKYTWGFQNLLWQNGANVYTADLKRAALAEPAAIEAAELWGSFHAQHKVAPPANASCRDAFIAGKLGMWLAGSWNFTGLREAKVDFAVAPSPGCSSSRSSGPCPTSTFPSARPWTRPSASGVGASVDDGPRGRWTLKADGLGPAEGHSIAVWGPRPADPAGAGPAGRWAAPEWVAAENLTRR